MSRFSITLEGQVFRRQYLVYVIEIISNGRRYFYVGQTGDRKYTTARPPFRRLMGHFEDTGKSTQNQIYRYIATDVLSIPQARQRETFTDDIKQRVEDFFVTSTVRMHVYPLEPFVPGVTHAEHMAVLGRVEEFERHVIRRFIDAHLPLGNRNFHRPSATSPPYPEVLQEIERDFGLSSHAAG